MIMPPATIFECVLGAIDSDSRPNIPDPAACELHSARTFERAPEASLYRGLLGCSATRAHGFAHQTIIDINVCPHSFLSVRISCFLYFSRKRTGDGNGEGERAVPIENSISNGKSKLGSPPETKAQAKYAWAFIHIERTKDGTQ